MKVILNEYPLNILDAMSSKNILTSINQSVPILRVKQKEIIDLMLKSHLSKASGMGLLSLIDNMSIGIYGKKARKHLQNLTQKQINRLCYNPSTIIRESQTNLLVCSCVMGYLSSLEAKSFSNGAFNVGKAVFGIFQGKNPLDSIMESVIEIDNKYNDICQLYHIAFLLCAYNSQPNLEHIIKQLLLETLYDKEEDSSFMCKKREFLFQNCTYKTIEDNLGNNIQVIAHAPNYEDLYNPFIQWRIEK